MQLRGSERSQVEGVQPRLELAAEGRVDHALSIDWPLSFEPRGDDHYAEVRFLCTLRAEMTGMATRLVDDLELLRGELRFED